MLEKSASEILPSLRDISDFCIHWPQLRNVPLNGLSGVNQEQQATIDWLVRLANHVCIDTAGTKGQSPENQ